VCWPSSDPRWWWTPATIDSTIYRRARILFNFLKFYADKPTAFANSTNPKVSHFAQKNEISVLAPLFVPGWFAFNACALLSTSPRQTKDNFSRSLRVYADVFIQFTRSTRPHLPALKSWTPNVQV
jgi:hypothetical protein